MLLAGLLWLAWGRASMAADHTWRAASGGNFNLNSRWDNGVPGVADNAVFPINGSFAVVWPSGFSAANVSAWFNASNGTVTLDVNSSFWELTNSFVVGQGLYSTAGVVLASGTLRVTNSTRTAVTDIRRGLLTLNAGRLETDFLSLTNGTNGQLIFNGGTLVTYGGVWSNGSSAVIGGSGPNPATLEVRAGTPFLVDHPLTLIGSNSAFNQLLVTDGGLMTSRITILGQESAAASNLALVSGTGSSWSVQQSMNVGGEGGFNRLIITNGGILTSGSASIASSGASTGSSNLAIITGAGSVWTNTGSFTIGAFGRGNQLLITNGGTLRNLAIQPFNLGGIAAGASSQVMVTDTNSIFYSPFSRIQVNGRAAFSEVTVRNGAAMQTKSLGLSTGTTSSNNVVTVTDPGTVWLNSEVVEVGAFGPFNQLIVSNSGTMVATNLLIGSTATSSNNSVLVTGGNLIVTNAFGTGVLEVRRGTNTINSGLLLADELWLTNGAQSGFNFTAGLVQVRATVCSNGTAFFVGLSAGPSAVATLELLGNNTHLFANNLTVRRTGLLKGNGTLRGNASIQGGHLSPGASLGRITIDGNLTMIMGTFTSNLFELNKALGTNDSIVVASNLTYSGTLVVTNLAGTLAVGDTFKLFTAGTYAGSFVNLHLPPLPPDLAWTNKLLFDGSIEILTVLPSDHHWTNALGGTYGVAANWLDGLAPTAIDHAIFTNAASYPVDWLAPANAADAWFNAASGIVTQNIGVASWTLTNSYIVGRDAGAAAKVAHPTGSLIVTNVAGTALMVVGQDGSGAYNLSGGSVVVDQLIATNNGPGFTNSTLNLGHGDLTTLHGTSILKEPNPYGLQIGETAGQIFTWAMRGGTNTTVVGPVDNISLGSFPGRRGVVVVDGAGTVWSNVAISLAVGGSGSANRLSITNGGRVFYTGSMTVGGSSSNNLLTLHGAGSGLFGGFLYVGNRSISNQMFIEAGAVATNFHTVIGLDGSASNSTLMVGGTGSRLTSSRSLNVGLGGSGSTLMISNNGLVVSTQAVVGANAGANNNTAWVVGGSLIVTNAARSAQLIVGKNGAGVLRLDGGLVQTDRLLLTNGSQSRLSFVSGTLQTRSTVVAADSDFSLGFGGPVLELTGAGTHQFADGLWLPFRARLQGNGTVLGNVTNAGVLAPGASIGRLTISGDLRLLASSSNLFELNQALGTNDCVAGVSNLSYGGTLVVTNLDGALAVGDSFKVFGATNYNGAFSSLVLPPLAPGLMWRNNLLVDGSIEVIVIPLMPFITLVPSGSSWKYLDDGSDQGTAWSAPAFDDSSWSNGVAELGYGEGDEATVVSFGPDAGNKYITTYFRRSFQVTDPETVERLILWIVRDDGVRVHLNGVELFRDNLPAGPVSFTTLAPVAAPEGLTGPEPIWGLVSSTNLVPGSNVLAVEIHQTLPESSDISFDLELTAVPANPLPPVTRVWTGEGTNGLWSNPTNWQGHGIPQVGDDLVFPAGAARLTSTNDFPHGRIAGSLRFETNGFNLHGDTLALLAAITNAAASGTNLLLMPITLLGPAHFVVPSPAAFLQMGGSVNGEGFDLTCDNASRLEIYLSGGIGTLTKNGPGVLSLLDARHTGPTLVNAGTLRLNGSTTSPLVEINGGATLAGTAVVGEVRVHSGTISPGSDLPGGSAIGTLTVTNLTFDPPPAVTTLRIESSTNGNDLVFVRGVASLGGAGLDWALSTNLPVGTVQSILRSNAPGATVVGSFLNFPEGELLETTHGTFRISYLGGTGEDVTLTRLAATNVWTGAGADQLWSNPANWQDGHVAAPGNSLLFPAVAQRLMLNDFPSNTLFGQFTFTADGYTLDGATLRLPDIQSSQPAGTNRVLLRWSLNASSPTLAVASSNAVLSLSGGWQTLAGTPSVAKNGPGLLELGGGGTGSAIFQLTDGPASLNGNCPGLQIVLRAGTFHGAGKVGPITHSPPTMAMRLGAGNHPGLAALLEAGRLLLTSNVTVEVDLLGGTPGTGHDQFRIAPTNLPVNLNNARLQVNLGYNPPPGTAHRIIDNTGINSILNTFAALSEGALLTNQGVVFAITYAGGDGNDVVLTRVNSLMDLTSVTPQPGGDVIALAGQGVPGWNFILEAATNLFPPVIWTPVSTNTTDGNGVFQFLQSISTNDPARFYRARAADGP